MKDKRWQVDEELSNHKAVYFNYARDLLIRKDLDSYLIIRSTPISKSTLNNSIIEKYCNKI
jgi:hypothetical protein